MSTNDRFLLDQKLEARREAQSPDVSTEDFFNVFVAELRTQDYQLPGPEHLQYGIVDGSQDCGVDGLFTFVNGTLVTDDFQRVTVSNSPDVDLLIIQAKTSQTFNEAPLEKLAVHLPEILNFERDESELSKICNSALMRESRRFLNTYARLVSKRPKLKIVIFYASRGDQQSTGVLEKGKLCAKVVEGAFPDANVSIEFAGCRELIELSRKPARIERTLHLAESPITSEAGSGWVCLVKLSRYFEFIVDPNSGRLDAALFEANVREHEGETDVNGEIKQTLMSDSNHFDFWWLNNGVTIIGESVRSPRGRQLIIESPQIVNGLQTSTEVYKHFSRDGKGGDRLILVRVVSACDATIRDRIVKATNSQNELPLSALRATEKFQRDLEEFLAPRNYYYDRRRNYSRTRGYDEKRVVSMSFAGHAVAATLWQRPDMCRLQGAALLNDDEWYERIFNKEMPLTMYHMAIWLLRKAQAAIVADKRVQGTSVEDWQYHVAMVAAMLLTRKSNPTPADLGGMNVGSLSPASITDALEIVSVEYSRAIPAGRSWTFEQLSGSEAIVDRVLDRTRSLLKSPHWRNWPNEPVPAEYAVRASDVFYKNIRGDG